jgi:hypothetical protein
MYTVARHVDIRRRQRPASPVSFEHPIRCHVPKAKNRGSSKVYIVKNLAIGGEFSVCSGLTYPIKTASVGASCCRALGWRTEEAEIDVQVAEHGGPVGQVQVDF